jgi:hypothetical protein
MALCMAVLQLRCLGALTLRVSKFKITLISIKENWIILYNIGISY